MGCRRLVEDVEVEVSRLASIELKGIEAVAEYIFDQNEKFLSGISIFREDIESMVLHDYVVACVGDALEDPDEVDVVDVKLAIIADYQDSFEDLSLQEACELYLELCDLISPEEREYTAYILASCVKRAVDYLEFDLTGPHEFCSLFRADYCNRRNFRLPAPSGLAA